MPKKILILYTSIGLGHKSIAENIGYHLAQAGYEVKLHDVLQLQAGMLVSASKAVHKGINNYLPFVWKWLYDHADHGWFAQLTLANRVRVASRNYHHIKEVIDSFQPDLVITTQTSASAALQYLKQQNWYKDLWAIAFSDYHLHRYWLYDGADFYLANIPEQKQQMIQLGIPADKIYVLGMTLPPRLPVDPVAIRQKLGIKTGEQVILMANGSLGIGLAAKKIENLARKISTNSPARLIIVCGKNQQLYDHLKQSLPDKVIVVGFYKPMAELYAISNIFLTKPGGLTVAEALQWQLPLLITHWLPGQEEINFNYLQSRKLIMAVPEPVEPDKFLPIIAAELGNSGFRQSLISNPFLLDLTQSGREGQVLVAAVRQKFHEV